MSKQTSIRILRPRSGSPTSIADDQALVVQLVIGESMKVLLMSDSGYEMEKRLIANGADLRSDILIKGQHHSGESASDAFLDAVKPRLIVATSRDFPAHQRINDEWAGRVRARGIKLFRQDETGAVELHFGSADWEARSYMTGEIFRSSSR